MRHYETLRTTPQPGLWSQANRPEETFEKVREQLRESAQRLLDLAEGRELSDAQMEAGMRLEACWVHAAANAYAEAARQRARMVVHGAREAMRRAEKKIRDEEEGCD